MITTVAQLRVIAKFRRNLYLGGIHIAQQEAALAVHRDMGRTTAFRNRTGRLRRGINNPKLVTKKTNRAITTTATIAVPYARAVRARTGFTSEAMSRAPRVTVAIMRAAGRLIAAKMQAVR